MLYISIREEIRKGDVEKEGEQRSKDE